MQGRNKDNIIGKFFPCVILVFLFLWQQTSKHTHGLNIHIQPTHKLMRWVLYINTTTVKYICTNEARNRYIYKPIIHVTTFWLLKQTINVINADCIRYMSCSINIFFSRKLVNTSKLKNLSVFSMHLWITLKYSFLK